MNPVPAAQESAVDIKQVGILLIPGEAWLDGDTRIDVVFVVPVQIVFFALWLHAFRNGVNPGDNPGAPCYTQDVRRVADA